MEFKWWGFNWVFLVIGKKKIINNQGCISMAEVVSTSCTLVQFPVRLVMRNMAVVFSVWYPQTPYAWQVRKSGWNLTEQFLKGERTGEGQRAGQSHVTFTGKLLKNKITFEYPFQVQKASTFFWVLSFFCCHPVTSFSPIRLSLKTTKMKNKNIRPRKHTLLDLSSFGIGAERYLRN